MKKKKILIINKSFELGGIQASLINMLEALHNQYDISLVVFNSKGPFLKNVPENVRLINVHPLVQTLGMTKEDCTKYGSRLQKLYKYFSAGWAKLFGNSIPITFAFLFQKKIGKFDAVISYHQEQKKETMVAGFGRFALERCISERKIAWIHSDFIATNLGTKQNYKIYSKFDVIVSVSKATMNSFNSVFPSLVNKSSYCYNYLPEKIIKKQSLEQIDIFSRNKDDLIITSVGRLSEEKGILNALKILSKIFKESNSLKWYIIGDGPQFEEIDKYIRENQLKKNVILLGFKNNPYPYIRECDFLFVPSRHETFGMVVAEAHILGTRVCASDIPVMKEVLTEFDYIWDGTIEGFPNLSNDFTHNLVECKNNLEEYRNTFSELINGRIRNEK